MTALDELLIGYFPLEKHAAVIAELADRDDVLAPVIDEIQAQIADLIDLLAFAQEGERLAALAHLEVKNGCT